MSYTKVIYEDELKDFLNNFKSLVMNEQIPDLNNKKEMMTFIILLEKHLKETLTTTLIYDVRRAIAGEHFKP